MLSEYLCFAWGSLGEFINDKNTLCETLRTQMEKEVRTNFTEQGVYLIHVEGSDQVYLKGGVMLNPKALRDVSSMFLTVAFIIEGR